MIRVTTAAILAGLGGAMLLAGPAQSASVLRDPAQARPAAAAASTDLSDQHRPRARIRIYSNRTPDGVYPRYDLGPNAVRVCNAAYVQEFRPSGTVIVPRVSCYWRQ